MRIRKTRTLLPLVLVLLAAALGCGDAATPTVPPLGMPSTVPGVPAPAIPGVAQPTAPAAPPAPVPPPAPVAATPDVAVRAYLQAGAASDEARIRELVDPACAQDAALLRVEAVRMMGIPMTIADLQVEVASVDAARASVRYTIRGSAHGSGGTTEVMGIRVQTDAVSMDGVTQSGTLPLALVGGAWRVTCGR